jgi:hypothetical protein
MVVLANLGALVKCHHGLFSNPNSKLLDANRQD